MKIALYNNFAGHFEIIGFLIELFRDHKITIFSNYDRFGNVQYYQFLFNKTVKNKTIENFGDKYLSYDKIFVITMDASIPSFLTHVKDRTYGFLHIYSRRSNYIDNYITLYPSQLEFFKEKINNVTKHFIYTYPFYNINSRPIFGERKYILQIGTLYDNDEDLAYFEKNIKYEIIYFTRRKYSAPRDMATVNHYLKNSLFILGRKSWPYPYSFTGSLLLAYSHNVPIILPETKQKEYNLPCITFKEKYSELVDYINNFNEEDYQKLSDRMEEIKLKIIDENKEKLVGM